MPNFTIQVQAQFEVTAETEEDACDAAVSMAMEIEPSEWGTLIITASKTSAEGAPTYQPRPQA